MKLYTLITACILYFAPLCAQTTGPAIPNTHPLITTDYKPIPAGGKAK